MQIKVCIGSACHLKGSYNVITALQEILEEDEKGSQVELKSVFCLGNCQNGVSVQIDDEPQIFSVSPKTARKFYEEEVLPRL